MKRNIIMALILAIACLVPATTAVAKTAKSGGPCATAGQKVTVYDKVLPNRGKTYTCVKTKSGLKYGPAIETAKIKSLLTVSQVWKGNSVTLSILNSQGGSCEVPPSTSVECKGFYLGWRANFKDDEKTVSYVDANTIISGLKIGDRGAFRLMYQENQNANPIVVKEFPFYYDY
jgi:hypothetical protein